MVSVFHQPAKVKDPCVRITSGTVTTVVYRKPTGDIHVVREEIGQLLHFVQIPQSHVEALIDAIRSLEKSDVAHEDVKRR